MSNIYIKEPPSNGKILLHTSLGDIDVELWSKEAPIACRNFVQLCLEGYYDGVIFHRVVPNFIVQGGDPTGTGEGGESIYGKPFKDEFHSRLRFVRRGLVAMANAGAHDNGSQFFFTLNSCTDLNKKHTIFGKVTGDTIYNLVRLGEVETDDNERPINPPYVKWTKVLANPFDDIVPRRVPENAKREEKKKKSKSNMRATKDFKLLSFGEEAEEEEEDTKEFDKKHATSSKSSHDLTNDPRLSSVPVVEEARKRKHQDPDSAEESCSDDASRDERIQSVKDKLKVAASKQDKRSKLEDDDNKASSMKVSESEALRKESRRLAREILQSRKAKEAKVEKEDSSESSGDELSNANPEFADYRNNQKIYREKTAKNKEKGSSREADTLALLASFKTKICSTELEEENGDEDLLSEDEENSKWWAHSLKDGVEELRDAKDINREVNEDRYDISDPRNPLNKRRREKSKKDRKERHHKSDRHRHR